MEAMIIGGTGLLGGYVKGLMPNAAAPDSRELDITDESSVKRAMDRYRPKAVINCAGATDVDRCENDPEWAFRLNCCGVEKLSRACEQDGVRLLHISTDYVFDGRGTTLLTETDSANPINIYGRSKLFGEQQALARSGTVMRVQWLYGGKKCGFIRLCRSGRDFCAVGDCFGSPTYAKDAAKMAVELLNSGQTGLFHGVNSGVVSWLEMAEYLGARPEPICSSMLHRPAERPKFTALNTGKLQKTCHIRSWQAAMDEFVSAEL